MSTELWVLGIIIGILVAIIGYVWNRLEGRVRKMEEWKQDLYEKKGGPVVYSEHTVLCNGATDRLTEKLDEKFSYWERIFDEKFKRLEIEIKKVNGRI